jgi:hypothetical protein
MYLILEIILLGISRGALGIITKKRQLTEKEN